MLQGSDGNSTRRRGLLRGAALTPTSFRAICHLRSSRRSTAKGVFFALLSQPRRCLRTGTGINCFKSSSSSSSGGRTALHDEIDQREQLLPPEQQNAHEIGHPETRRQQPHPQI